jgi:hypothetical protein
MTSARCEVYQTTPRFSKKPSIKVLQHDNRSLLAQSAAATGCGWC